MYEDFLQKVPLFAQLPGEDLTRLCKLVKELFLQAGELLFEEGSVADSAYIIYDGELEVIKHVDGREVFVDLRSMPGTVIGEMALLEEGVRLATVRARRDSFLLTLDHSQVHELINTSPTATRVMLHTLARRWRGLEAHVRHDEQMARLGTLTAGIAHELNNPVAAVMRSVGQLQALLADSEQARVTLDRLNRTEEQETVISSLSRLIRNAAVSPLALDPLAQSDQEAEVEEWLAGRADGSIIVDAWEVTSALVDLGLGTVELTELARTFTSEQLSVLLRWLAVSYTTHRLLNEIVQGASRIANLVSALKAYVYLDQAPIQDVNVHIFTTRPPGMGSGLGLTTTYNIVQQHKGEINVTSEPGRTVFQVRLPVNMVP